MHFVSQTAEWSGLFVEPTRSHVIGDRFTSQSAPEKHNQKKSPYAFARFVPCVGHRIECCYFHHRNHCNAKEWLRNGLERKIFVRLEFLPGVFLLSFLEQPAETLADSRKSVYNIVDVISGPFFLSKLDNWHLRCSDFRWNDNVSVTDVLQWSLNICGMNCFQIVIGETSDQDILKHSSFL